MQTLVFGGAFDPPHVEHIRLVKTAVETLGCDRLVLLPTCQPPHKSKGILSFEERRALAMIAFDGVAKDVIVDDVEFLRAKDGLPNYSAKVLPIMKQKYGDIVYLIGGDSLERLSTWYQPDVVMSVCPIAVGARNGYYRIDVGIAKACEVYPKAVFYPIEFEGKAVSSTRIRTELLLGIRPSGVTEKVYDYIRDNGLYGEYDKWLKMLKDRQNEQLFAHTKNVVLRAEDLNSAHDLRLDYTKVFIAAILHDNAKQKSSFEGYDVPSDSVGTPVLHQFLGAECARIDFGVEDSEILDAIRCHTTAKGNMTTFEKLIYTADSTSYDRDYEPIPSLAKIVDEDFEKGFVAVLDYTYRKLLDRGGAIYPMTVEAAKYYL